MITFTQGNLLETRAEALVNTVNTVGVMGKQYQNVAKRAGVEKLTPDFESLDVSDSGLRFTERQDGHFSCPRCGADVVAGEKSLGRTHPARRRTGRRRQGYTGR